MAIVNKVNLTEAQRTVLEHLWFIYGNNGSCHTQGNHKWIQDLLERGEDSREFFRLQGRIASWKPLSPECEAAVDKILRLPQPAPAPKSKFTKAVVVLYHQRLDGDYDFVAAFDRSTLECMPQNAPLLEELLSGLILGLQPDQCAVLEFDGPDFPYVWDGPVPPLPPLYGL